MEYDTFLGTLADNITWADYNYDDFKSFMRNESLVTLDEYADHLVMTLPSPRINWY
jgi:hypothetical protein